MNMVTSWLRRVGGARALATVLWAVGPALAGPGNLPSLASPVPASGPPAAENYELKREEFRHRCLVWRPQNCRPNHRKADQQLIEKLTKGFTRQQAAEVMVPTAWALLLDKTKRDAASALLRFNQVLILNESSAEGWWGAGTAAAEIGLMEDAQRCLRKSIALNPRVAEVHFNLARLLVVEGRDWKTAAESASKAVALDAKFRDAHKLLALILFQLNRFVDARTSYERAIQLGSDRDAAFESRLGKAGAK